jgi:hypothetical protein
MNVYWSLCIRTPDVLDANLSTSVQFAKMLFGMSSYRPRLCESPNSDGTISSTNRIKVCGTKVWGPKMHLPNNDCSVPSSGGSNCFGADGRLLKGN